MFLTLSRLILESEIFSLSHYRKRKLNLCVTRVGIYELDLSSQEVDECFGVREPKAYSMVLHEI